MSVAGSEARLAFFGLTQRVLPISLVVSSGARHPLRGGTTPCRNSRWDLNRNRCDSICMAREFPAGSGLSVVVAQPELSKLIARFPVPDRMAVCVPLPHDPWRDFYSRACGAYIACVANDPVAAIAIEDHRRFRKDVRAGASGNSESYHQCWREGKGSRPSKVVE